MAGDGPGLDLCARRVGVDHPLVVDDHREVGGLRGGVGQGDHALARPRRGAVADHRGDRGAGRQRPERSRDADRAVVGDRAQRCPEVGDLERRPERVLLDVDRVGSGQPVGRLAEQVERVSEAAHQPVADRGDGADGALGDVAGGDGDAEVATGHDVGLGGCDARSARRTDGVGVLRQVGPGGLAVEDLGADAGDSQRHGERLEALLGSGLADPGAAGEQARGVAADLDPVGKRAREGRLHLREGRDAGDRRGTEGEPVGDRPDEASVGGIDRRTAHALPDPAHPVDLGGRQPRHHQVDARQDAVLEHPEDLSGEAGRHDSLGDGRPVHGLTDRQLRDRVGHRAVADGCGRVRRGQRPGLDHGGRQGQRKGGHQGYPEPPSVQTSHAVLPLRTGDDHTGPRTAQCDAKPARIVARDTLGTLS